MRPGRCTVTAIRFIIYVDDVPVEVDITQCSPTLRIALRELAAEAKEVAKVLPMPCMGFVPVMPKRT